MSARLQRPIPGGLLVAVEGIDGVGKTSVSAMLAQWCGERGLACTFSKEPTGCHWGQLLRKSASTGRLSLEEELDLFYKDRADHVAHSIGPTLAEGGIVILDRYYWSTAAYQGARGADPHAIIEYNETHFPVPDLVLLLEAGVDTGLGRVRARGDVPNEFETRSALQQCHDIFVTLPALSRAPCVIISADRPVRDVVRSSLDEFKKAATAKLKSAGIQAPEPLALFGL
jgi:dTMP kinase